MMDLTLKLEWQNTVKQSSKRYKCGYCGSSLASDNGYYATWQGSGVGGFIYICHFCNRPTYFDRCGDQIPGSSFGDTVQHIGDPNINLLYEEARNSTSANCYTATVLCCRKLLMHIAVSKGAEENQSFASYVTFLVNNNFIPPDAHPWVDHIREKGNEANHEIVIMGQEDAEELITFLEMLLKFIYEFPETVKNGGFNSQA